MRNHQDLHFQVYGDADWKPKFHYALHIPDQILRDGRVYDCFVVERSHQLPKLLAAAVKQTGSFEKNIIGRSLLVHLRNLEDWDERGGLRGASHPFPELGIALGRDDVLLARSAATRDLLLGSEDLVQIDDHVFLFTAAVSSGNDLGILGHLCTLAHRRSSSAGIYERQTYLSFEWIHDRRVRRAHAWSTLDSGQILALWPDLR